MREGVEAIAFLAGSETRVRLLEELAGSTDSDSDPEAEAEGLSRGDLRERLDAARTTITRNLEALIDRGWVRETEGRYVATPAGRLVAGALANARAAVGTADRLTPFLRWFPADEPEPPVEALRGARVVTGESGDPYAPVNTIVNCIRRSGGGRVLLPFLGLHAFEACHERVVEDGTTHEVVVTPAVAETLRTGDYAGLFADLRACDRFAAYVYDGEIPYYLGLIDEREVEIGVDEDGTPRALLRSEAPEVREWAEAVYERYRAPARPIPRD
ncbi:winged helix-turn-helix domain-containing protein [Halobacteriales archaeon QS_5_70_17]|nr:MAG: winged helix-turn-helix domain-containing protein [Halobacteriales archaeon QS_5_70_17]